jgi:flagellar biosynthesis chaperone FliJ
VTLRNDTELNNTRRKLRELEDRYDRLRRQENADARLRKLTMSSLKQLINQLTEEIARYEAHQLTPKG